MASIIPYHISTLPKPQLLYKIRPNNDKPFIHPNTPEKLNSINVSNFVDHPKNLDRPTKIPMGLDSTPYTYVDSLPQLIILRDKLSEIDEFAVDLEANQYRSYKGLTCLMQISTRTEDFVVDTLKLHNYIGDYLGNLFIDSSKRKVMHGASNDILWLQRDFGIYVCNLFDTMHASKVMKLQRNSLEHLLMYFCGGVIANKQYQTADWRLRPLPYEMLHYAREDTHYLLYIYDMMRKRLISDHTTISEFGSPLLEVYQRSHSVCASLYKTEMFTEDSYKSLHGLNETKVNSKQLEVAGKLYKWRDMTARKDDESTGYVMPNKLPLELAKTMPKTAEDFVSIVANSFTNHPYVKDKAAQMFENVRGSTTELKAEVGKSCRAEQGKYEEVTLNEATAPSCYVPAACSPGYYYTAAPLGCNNVTYAPPQMMQPFYCTDPEYCTYIIH